MPENNKHLLIIRLSAMGDVAMTVPVIKALRRDNPGLKITILTRPFFKPFFRDIGEIDFLTPDLKGRHKGFMGIVRLYRDALACRITHVADLHDVLRTKILRRMLLMSGKKVAVIDKGRHEKRAMTRKYRKELVPLKTTVERYRETIMRLGIDFAEPVSPVRKPAALSEQITALTGKKTKNPWIGVAPFAQHKGKIYPTDLTDRLIDILSRESGKVFIFGGGQYEKEFGECMQERHKNVVSIIGKIPLDAEMDLISNIDVMVTMDSASMHIASLVGTPVVSVWGATHPYAGFYGFGQYPANAAQLTLPCRPCSIYGNKPCMYKDYRCLQRITPDEIVGRVRENLAKKP